MKKIYNLIHKFLSILSIGFFSYIKWFIIGIKKLFRIDNKKIDKYLYNVELSKQKPSYFFLSCIFISIFVLCFNIVDSNNSSNSVNNSVKREIFTQKSLNDNDINNLLISISTSNSNDVNISNNSNTSNLYSNYSKYSIDDISVEELSNKNNNIIGWLLVDSTSINYPIVKSNDNSYYLSHDINNNKDSSGWIFLDYRNNLDKLSSNTIIYGNNSNNDDAFGTLDNLFDNNVLDKSTYNIVLISNKYKYTFKMFSIYEIRKENYYLQTYVSNYEEFISNLRNRSSYDFKAPTLIDNYKNIITLTTSNSDNTKRLVVHARLISKEEI